MTPRPVGRLVLGAVVILAVLLLSFAVVEAWQAQANARLDRPLPRPSATLHLPGPPAEVRVRHEIVAGDSLGSIVQGYGLDPAVLVQAAAEFHDLARLRTGRQLTLLWPADADLVGEVHYPLDEDRTLVLVRGEDGWTSRVDEIHYTRTPVRREFTVERSLWEAAIDAGLRPADILAVARVFESDVDFNTEIQKGDRVEMVVDELVAPDGFTKLGPPQAVRLRSGQKVLTATLFTRPGAETPEYWDDEGINRKGAFLRSPLEFSRVTSGFSRGRFHPVLKVKRPHNGVDFGAPTGTPVRAVGGGRVERAGRSGGHGNFVKIQHQGPYSTSYSHLNRILVRPGQEVAQGQVIGEVGATGLATGPHLHFQLWVNGRYQDPLSTELPRNEQLPPEAMAAFALRRDQLAAVLDGEAPATSAP